MNENLLISVTRLIRYRSLIWYEKEGDQYKNRT